jgi:hypothetical protein
MARPSNIMEDDLLTLLIPLLFSFPQTWFANIVLTNKLTLISVLFHNFDACLRSDKHRTTVRNVKPSQDLLKFKVKFLLLRSSNLRNSPCVSSLCLDFYGSSYHCHEIS